jgi:flagellar biosynthetic protein FliR
MLLTMAFYSFVVAGEGVGHQMGLGTPSFIDPSLPGQYTVMGGAFLYIALGIFALVGGPGQMLVLLKRSIDVLPPGQIMETPDSLEIVIVAGSELFRVALQAAAPLIAAVFCAQMLLAVLARAVPTMNLFIEGPGLTVGTGVLGLIAVVHTFIPLVQQTMIHRMEQLAHWLLPM